MKTFFKVVVWTVLILGAIAVGALICLGVGGAFIKLFREQQRLSFFASPIQPELKSQQMPPTPAGGAIPFPAVAGRVVRFPVVPNPRASLGVATRAVNFEASA